MDAAEITELAATGELTSEMIIIGGVGLADTLAGGFVTGAMLGGLLAQSWGSAWRLFTTR